MTLIDFDGMFDEKLTEYMEQNKGKYNEKQWENLIPKLYKKFGDTYVAKVKCTPKEYYAAMENETLVETFRAHLDGGVPVPEFLCDELEKRNPVDALIPLLDSKNSETALYALNLLGGNEKAFDAYFKIVTDPNADADVKDAAIENLKENADAAKERALKLYHGGQETEFMLEILSRVKERDEEIYSILCSAFKTGENLPMRASYLAAYGDERALPILLDKIDEESIGFVEFQELKYAIEALGGEYTKPRDFSLDDDFITIGEASQNEGFSEIGLKS